MKLKRFMAHFLTFLVVYRLSITNKLKILGNRETTNDDVDDELLKQMEFDYNFMKDLTDTFGKKIKVGEYDKLKELLVSKKGKLKKRTKKFLERNVSGYTTLSSVDKVEEYCLVVFDRITGIYSRYEDMFQTTEEYSEKELNENKSEFDIDD